MKKAMKAKAKTPATKAKRPAARKPIDATTVATVWHTMQTICKEMRHLVDRTAQNYLIG
ncbi:MAG: hypothetical protein IT565_07480, partial [Rhodospirillales bacterium]|nr:hypothetical protein [Rhodospirillales bacterium]